MIFFSGNTKAEEVAAIKGIFNLNAVSRHDRYLGLPSMVGRNKRSLFNDVKLRVLSKMSNWQNKFFSSGGKEVLINAVAQAVPCYAMSVFRIPISLCDDMEKARAKFWWGSRDDKRCIHWTKWERMCKTKIRGGMGFRDFVCFNQAPASKASLENFAISQLTGDQSFTGKIFQTNKFLACKTGVEPVLHMKKHFMGETSYSQGLQMEDW